MSVRRGVYLCCVRCLYLVNKLLSNWCANDQFKLIHKKNFPFKLKKKSNKLQLCLFAWWFVPWTIMEFNFICKVGFYCFVRIQKKLFFLFERKAKLNPDDWECFERDLIPFNNLLMVYHITITLFTSICTFNIVLHIC